MNHFWVNSYGQIFQCSIVTFFTSYSHSHTAVLQSIRLISLKTNIALEAWVNAALSWLNAAQPHLTCMQNFRVCSAL